MNYELRESLLRIENLNLTFGSHVVIDGLNAEIRNIHRPGLTQGQVVGLLGPSGRGKTQFSRILAGLQPQSFGQIFMSGNPRVLRPGAMGMVMQHYPLLEHRTIEGNLLLAARLGGLDHDEATTRIKAYLTRFNLEDKRDFYPVQLSGGQRQRVAIIQQLINSEKFLIMDEPFSGLDPLMKEEAMQMVREVAATDELLTIIVITHDVEAAVAISDTLWMLGWPPDKKHGANIRFTFDLMERGLAWNSHSLKSPGFVETVNEVSSKFVHL